MQKFDRADWLRPCQSQTMQKVEIECKKLKLSPKSWNWVQKLEIKLIDRKVAEEKLTDGQSNLFFSNQEHNLDGTIHGAIFPWLRDSRAFLLLNHLKIIINK